MFDVSSMQEDDEDDLREEVMVYLSVMRRKSMDKEEEIKNPIEYYNRLWKCDALRVDTNMKVKSKQQVKTSVSSSSVSDLKSQFLSGEVKKKEQIIPSGVINDTTKSKECFTDSIVDISTENDETESVRRSSRKRKIKTNDFDFEFEYPDLFNSVEEDEKSNFDKDFRIQTFYNDKKPRKKKKKKLGVHDDSDLYKSYCQYKKHPKITRIRPVIDTYEKYLQYRERNNESCRRNRLNQKLHQLELQKELISLENENIRLLSKVNFIESRIKKLGMVLMRLKKTDGSSSLQGNTAHNDSIPINLDKISVILEMDKLSEDSDVSTSVIKTIKKELNDESSVMETSDDDCSNNDSLEKSKTINNYDIVNQVFVSNSKSKVCEPYESNDDAEIDFESCTKKSIIIDNEPTNEDVIDEEKMDFKDEVIKFEIVDNKSYNKDTIVRAKIDGKDDVIKVEIVDKSYNEDAIDEERTYCKDKVIKVEIVDKSYNEDAIDMAKTNTNDEVIKVEILDNKSYSKDIIDKAKTHRKEVLKTDNKFCNKNKAKISVIDRTKSKSKDEVVKNGWGTNFLEKYYEKNRDSIEDNCSVESFDKVNDSVQDNSNNKITNDSLERLDNKPSNFIRCDVNINNNTNVISHFKSSESEDKKRKENLFIERSYCRSDNEVSINDDQVVKVCTSSDKKYQTVSLIANTNNYNSSSSIASSSSETNESKSCLSSSSSSDDDDDLSLVIASDQDYDSEESDNTNSNNLQESTESIDNQNDFDKLDLKSDDRSILDNLYLNAKEKVDAYEYINNALKIKELGYKLNKVKTWEEHRRRNNIASKKSRFKRKLCIMVAQQQCMSLEQENVRLKSEVSKLEIYIKKLNSLLLRVFKKN